MRFELAPFALPADYAEGILPLEDAKAHCRVLDDSEDVLIGAFRDAAIDMVERYCGVRLAVCEGLVWRAESLPRRVELGVKPILGITGMTWLDSQGEEQTFDHTALRVGVGGEVLPRPAASWPSGIGGGIAITFDAGYEDDERPPVLVDAARLFLAHLYENREAVITGTISGDIPLGFKMKCSQFRSVI